MDSEKEELVKPNNLARTLLLAAIALVSGCAGAPKVQMVNSEQDLSAMSSPARNLLVMALYPDEDEETRVVIENAVVQAFRDAGLQASAGYRALESYDDMGSQEEAIKAVLRKQGQDAIVMIDPVRVKDYDPEAYAARRAAYRAWGMDTSASFALMGQLAAEADAAKAEMDVLMWDLGSERFVWYSEYDLNAPGAYELKVARQYASEFGGIVAEQLKKSGLVE